MLYLPFRHVFKFLHQDCLAVQLTTHSLPVINKQLRPMPLACIVICGFTAYLHFLYLLKIILKIITITFYSLQVIFPVYLCFPFNYISHLLMFPIYLYFLSTYVSCLLIFLVYLYFLSTYVSCLLIFPIYLCFFLYLLKIILKIISITFYF